MFRSNCHSQEAKTAVNVKMPSKSKLWRILDKGNPRNKIYALTMFLSITASLILTVLSIVDLKDNSSRLPWWLLGFIVSLIFIILSEVLKAHRKFPETEYKDFLDGIIRFFNTSVILNGDARAIVFIYGKKEKAFFTLCCTNGNGAAKNYRSEEKSRNHIWYQSFINGDPRIDDVPIDQRGDRNIIGVFSVPISNKKGEVVGILIVDAKKSYNESCFLNDCIDEIEKKKRLASFGESLQAFANNITSTIHSKTEN